MNPMTDERLAEWKRIELGLRFDSPLSPIGFRGETNELYVEIDRLRVELAETQAEMKPLAAHVQRDFEQAEEIARLRTRNEKLQAELAECQKQAAAMRSIGQQLRDSTVQNGRCVCCQKEVFDPDNPSHENKIKSPCKTGQARAEWRTAYEAAKGKE